MDNETFFNYLKSNGVYNSLNELSIENNKLIYQNKKLLLQKVNLSDLDSSLFILNANEIFDIIFLLELEQYIDYLLEKNEITKEEEEYILSFIKTYLSINQKLLEGTSINQDIIFKIGIPIYKAYDEIYQNNPASIIIKNAVNNATTDIENGKNKQQRLVLTNPKYQGIEEDNNDLSYFEKAGFATIILITFTILATFLYIAFFIVNK